MNWLERYSSHTPPPPSAIDPLKEQMAAVAQSIYDEWEQNENGEDVEFGVGGICDAISREIGGVLIENGFDTYEGSGEGEDHSWTIAVKDGRAFGVDIPCHIYESGGGYSWRKKPGVKLSPSDVQVFEIPYEDVAWMVDHAEVY